MLSTSPTEDPIERLEKIGSRIKLDAHQWALQFPKTPHEPDKEFFRVQRDGSLECDIYDTQTGELSGWLRRY